MTQSKAFLLRNIDTDTTEALGELQCCGYPYRPDNLGEGRGKIFLQDIQLRVHLQIEDGDA